MSVLFYGDENGLLFIIKVASTLLLPLSQILRSTWNLSGGGTLIVVILVATVVVDRSTICSVSGHVRVGTVTVRPTSIGQAETCGECPRTTELTKQLVPADDDENLNQKIKDHKNESKDVSTRVWAGYVKTNTVAYTHLNKVKEERESKKHHIVEDRTSLVEIGHSYAKGCENGLEEEEEGN